MEQVFVNLIRNGLWALERVPKRWRAEVENMLQEGSREEEKA